MGDLMQTFTKRFSICLFSSIGSFNAYADNDLFLEYLAKRAEFLNMNTYKETTAISYSTIWVLEDKYVKKCETLYSKEKCSDFSYNLAKFMYLDNNYDNFLINMGYHYKSQYDEISDHSDTLQSCLSEKKSGEKNCDEMVNKLINQDEDFLAQLCQELESSKSTLQNTYAIFTVEIKKELIKIVQNTNAYTHQNGYDFSLDDIEEEINDALNYVIDNS